MEQRLIGGIPQRPPLAGRLRAQQALQALLQKGVKIFRRFFLHAIYVAALGSNPIIIGFPFGKELRLKPLEVR